VALQDDGAQGLSMLGPLSLITCRLLGLFINDLLGEVSVSQDVT